MSNRLSIEVEGVEDAAIVVEFKRAIQESFDELALPGPWHVVVRPSRVGGRWDFSISGLDVRHVLSIAVPAGLLPILIPPRLTESLNRILSTKVAIAAPRTVTPVAAV